MNSQGISHLLNHFLKNNETWHKNRMQNKWMTRKLWYRYHQEFYFDAFASDHMIAHQHYFDCELFTAIFRQIFIETHTQCLYAILWYARLRFAQHNRMRLIKTQNIEVKSTHCYSLFDWFDMRSAAFASGKCHSSIEQGKKEKHEGNAFN